MSQQRESMCDDAIDFWSNLALCADTPAFRRAGAEAQSMAIAIEGVTDLGFLKVYKDTVGQALRDGDSAGCVREALDQAYGAGSAALGVQAAEQAKASEKAAEEYEHLKHEHRQLDAVIRTSLLRARCAGLRRKRLREAAKSGSMPYALYKVLDSAAEGSDNKRELKDGNEGRGGSEDGPCSCHKPLDGLFLPLNDKRWIDFWPPNCLGCDCAVKIIEKSEAAERRLEQTPDVDMPDRYKFCDRSFRSGFSSAEHPLLPHADSLADELKSMSLSFPVRHEKSLDWYENPMRCEAFNERFLLGLKAFATLETGTASRGEMSVNLSVLGINAPDRLVGHVATVTDAGYQQVYKELVDRLDLDQGKLHRIAKEILKDLPSNITNTPSITPSKIGFDVSVADRQVSIGFEHATDNGRQFFQMKEVSGVSEDPQQIMSWYQTKPSSKTVTVG